MFKLGVCKCCSDKVSSEAMICPHCGQPCPYSEAPEDPEEIFKREVRALLSEGEKIKAIKLVREKKYMDLPEAKKFVEKLEQNPTDKV
jgi:ribosomal protein L7/L12